MCVGAHGHGGSTGRGRLATWPILQTRLFPHISSEQLLRNDLGDAGIQASSQQAQRLVTRPSQGTRSMEYLDIRIARLSFLGLQRSARFCLAAMFTSSRWGAHVPTFEIPFTEEACCLLLQTGLNIVIAGILPAAVASRVVADLRRLHV